MKKATKTLNPLHFEDLDPRRFEDLVRQIVHGIKDWQSLEATGRLGADEGVDIRGTDVVLSSEAVASLSEDDNTVELLTEERQWIIQCKRHKKLHPKQMESLIEEAIPHGTDAPYGFIVALACDVSKRTHDVFRQQSQERGVQEFDLWTRSRIEDFLFQPRFDHLLFAYFDISLRARRRSKVTELRQRLSVKRKILRAIKKSSSVEADPRDVYYQGLLVRDIEDELYPFENEIDPDLSFQVKPWHVVEAHSMYSRGLVVRRASHPGRKTPDGEWDIDLSSPNLLRDRLENHLPWDFYERDRKAEHEELEKIRASIPEEEYATIDCAHLLPFANVLEVDALGDNIHNIPHIFCRFHPRYGPYEARELFLLDENGDYMILDDADRRKLFK